MQLDRLLIVDDDASVLRSLERQTQEHFDVCVASDADVALSLVERAAAPFAVILSDLAMPGTDGVSLLRHVMVSSPETVRVAITGEADLDRVMCAINDGHVFRFLRKPCPHERLLGVLRVAARQHELVVGERDLLERTLNGAVAALLDTMAIIDPTTFAASTRIAAIADELIELVAPPDAWSIRLSAMLCHVGAVALPTELLRRIREDRPVSPDERCQYDEATRLGQQLLGRIPRLEPVAAIIAEAHRSGSGEVGVASQFLRIAQDLEAMEARGLSRLDALEVMTQRAPRYDPTLLTALRDRVASLVEPVRELPITALREGMVFVEAVYDSNQVLLVGRGQAATERLLARLRNRAYRGEAPERVVVRCPQQPDAIGPSVDMTARGSTRVRGNSERT